MFEGHLSGAQRRVMHLHAEKHIRRGPIEDIYIGKRRFPN